MSMLAEPRRKAKYGDNPRGETWARDENKIGQKMIEKMGWSKGKGLGAKEDGNTEHVKVQVKNDTRGVGCTKKHADNWLAHQDDFNALLSSLNENSTGGGSGQQTETVQSLEVKSKAAKSRVHYQKFSKGKDLSLRKTDEMDCIFGRRKSATNTPTTQSKANSAENSSDESSADGKERNRNGVITISSTLSVQEYFAQKMALLKAKRSGESCTVAVTTSTTVVAAAADSGHESESELTTTVGFGFGSTVIESVQSESKEKPDSDSNEPQPKKKKSKKKKKEKEEVEDSPEKDLTDGEKETSEAKEKKKKSKKKSEDKLSDEERKTKRKCKKSKDERTEDEVVSKKSKKKSKPSKEEDSTTETKNKKKCKKSKEEKLEEEVEESEKATKKKCKKSKDERKDKLSESSDTEEKIDTSKSQKRKFKSEDDSIKPEAKKRKSTDDTDIMGLAFKGSNLHKIVGYNNGETWQSVNRKKKSKK